MLDLVKKLKNVSRMKPLVLVGGVMLTALVLGMVAYGSSTRPNVNDLHEAKDHKEDDPIDKKPVLSKDSTANKPSEVKKVTPNSSTPGGVSSEPRPTSHQNNQSPSQSPESPTITQPSGEDNSLVASATSVTLGTSEAHPKSVAITVRYRSGRVIEFLQVSKQPRFEVSPNVYIGSIFVGEASAGTTAVSSRTLLVSQLVPDSPAVSGTVYVTTSPNSPPLAVHISWNPIN